MSVIHQLFGLFGEKYYMVPNCSHVVIPENIDYTSKMVQTQLSDTYPQAEINMYHYHCDLLSNCNVVRVSNMKQMLLGENITEMDSINPNYVIGIRYELYNNSGKLIKSGTSECEARYCTAQINDEIKEDNVMEYRKALVYDGRIEIPIPEIARYGVKNAYSQHPYTLKIKNIYVVSSIGDSSLIIEKGTQMNDYDDCVTHHKHHAYSSNYKCHMHDTICDRNFASCFLTNARVGTTMIDATVLPMKLEIPEKTERVELCSIDCNGPEYTITLNKKLNLIILNLEVLLDNFNLVYDIEDIIELLKYNAGETEEPDYNPDDLCPIYPDGCCGSCEHKHKHDHDKEPGHLGDDDEPGEDEDPEGEDDPDDPDNPPKGDEDEDDGDDEEEEEEDTNKEPTIPEIKEPWPDPDGEI